MVPWNAAYHRVTRGRELRRLFGRNIPKWQWTPIVTVAKFNAVPPALLSDGTDINVGDAAVTAATIAAPTTNIVPSNTRRRLVSFPGGALVLGITSCGTAPQRDTGGFTYGPTWHPGSRDLYNLDFRYTGNKAIFGRKDVPSRTVDANSPFNQAPPFMADPSSHSGIKGQILGRELIVTPGQGIITFVASNLLPNAAPATTPNLAVHVCFHCMVPTDGGAPTIGEVRS